MIARPANHTGPGQSEKCVVPSFIRQVLEIKAGRRRCFTVGNLDSVRDFTDVRDVVRAYRLMLEGGVSTGVYALGTPNRLAMRELLAKVAHRRKARSREDRRRRGARRRASESTTRNPRAWHGAS